MENAYYLSLLWNLTQIVMGSFSTVFSTNNNVKRQLKSHSVNLALVKSSNGTFQLTSS